MDLLRIGKRCNLWVFGAARGRTGTSHAQEKHMAKKKAKKKASKKKSPVKKAGTKKPAKKGAKKTAKKKARRTVLYSSKGKKLYAVRDKGGKFKDIQQYSRAHAMDIRRSSKSEKSAASTSAVASSDPGAASM